MEIVVHYQNLNISFGVSSKGALLPGLPHRAPSERDVPFLEPFFTPLTKSPVYEPHFVVPQQGPYRERGLSPELSFTHPPGSPVKQPPSSFPSHSSLRERERDAPLVEFPSSS
jgi:hypothetical protein